MIQQNTLDVKNNKPILYSLLGLASVLLIVLPWMMGKYAFLALPISLLAGVIFFFYKQYLITFLCACLPLSHEIKIPGMRLNLAIPGEVLVAVLSIAAVYALILNSKETAAAKKNPITWLALCAWLACAISMIFSSMPFVSLKSFILLTTYLLVFFFYIPRMVVKEEMPLLKPFLAYAVVLCGLAIYATAYHSTYGFNKLVSGHVVKPFYSDHTIYGACLAFILPISVGVVRYAGVFGLSFWKKMFWLTATGIFLVAVFFSHSRASWMSIMAGIGFYFLLQWRVSFKSLMTVFITLLVLFFIFQKAIAPAFLKNENDSKAKGAKLDEQLKSVTSMKKDVSNAERVNRWLCAFRMFVSRPLTGYGAGTYQYQYLPFQRSAEMTYISVTSAKVKHLQGFGGTAHSEYLLALSETGLLGGLAIILLLFAVVRAGMNLTYQITHEPLRVASMLITISMVTYFVHGFFNNFLTTDKAGFLFWGGCGLLVIIEICWKAGKKIQVL